MNVCVFMLFFVILKCVCILELGLIDNQAEIVSILLRKVGIMQSWAATKLFMTNNSAGTEFHWQ